LRTELARLREEIREEVKALEAKERRITRCRTRIGAFTRWQREAELAGQEERVSYYARKIREEYVRMSEIMREREREREIIREKAEREREIRSELVLASRRVAAFSRWFYYYRRIAVSKNKLRKVREYRREIKEQRRKLEEIKERIERLREREREYPPLEELEEQLERQRKLLSYYSSRLSSVKAEIRRVLLERERKEKLN